MVGLRFSFFVAASQPWYIRELQTTEVIEDVTGFPSGPFAQPWERAAGLHHQAELAMIRGDVLLAAELYFKACQIRRLVDFDADTAAAHPLMTLEGDEGFLRTGRLKLRHDAEQLEYLVGFGHVRQQRIGLAVSGHCSACRHRSCECKRVVDRWHCQPRC